jgi:hypothetical protein
MARQYEDDRSPAGIKVALEGMLAAAKDWIDLSGQMGEVAALAADQNLEVTAFMVVDNPATSTITALDLKNAYDKMHNWLVGLFQEAATEFVNISSALEKCARWYETTDDESSRDFDSIARDPDDTKASLRGQP